MTLPRLLEALKSSLYNTSDRAFISLEKENPVKLINVLQLYLEAEEVLSGRDTCSHDCPYYNTVAGNNGNGCFGTARECDGFAFPDNEINTYRKVPNVDRIYEGYTLKHSILTSKKDFGRIPPNDEGSIEHFFKVTEFHIKSSVILCNQFNIYSAN